MEATIVDFQNSFIFILLSSFSLFYYYVFFRKAKNPQAGFDLPPSPPSLPIIGHLHLLLSVLAHQSLQKISTKYGPLLHLRVFSFPILLVSSASAANEIYKTHDLNVSSRTFSADDSLTFGSSGFISAPYGDYFKFMKKLLVTKLLRPQEIQRSRCVRAKELEQFYFNLLDKCWRIPSIALDEENSRIKWKIKFLILMKDINSHGE